MRPEQFRADSLVRLLKQRTLVTMGEMRAALGSPTAMTIFRKLRSIPYRTSYSHRGSYYALETAAEFSPWGLWTCRGVHFSQFGSLIDTAESFVTASECGYFGTELARALQVEVKEPLRTLWRAGRIAREKVGGLFLYCSGVVARRRQQILARKLPGEEEPFERLRDPAAVAAKETRAAILLFLGTLDEKQRRLYAGLESVRIGKGGDRRIAEVTGLDVHTIARGRRQLLGGELPLGRIRRPGAGRKAIEKKRPRYSPPSRS